MCKKQKTKTNGVMPHQTSYFFSCLKKPNQAKIELADNEASEKEMSRGRVSREFSLQRYT